MLLKQNLDNEFLITFNHCIELVPGVLLCKRSNLGDMN